MIVEIVPLDVNNWLQVCDLSVTEEQKQIFSIPNVYWIGISRYEEKSELFAIKYGGEYAGLIGGGIEPEGDCCFINPIMIDKAFQRKGIAARAIVFMETYLRDKFVLNKINIGYRKINAAAAGLYQKLGYSITSETETEFICTKILGESFENS